MKLAAALAALVAARALAQPLPVLNVNSGCSETVGLNSVTNPAYSGRYVFGIRSFGWAAANADSGLGQNMDGLGKAMAPSCPPKVPIIGDCWQSVTSVTASTGTPKWLVAVGASEQCHQQSDGSDIRGLQVWGWNAGTQRMVWKGEIKQPGISRLVPAILDGDLAYVVAPNTINPPYYIFALNTMSVTGPFTGPPPSGEGRQAGIDGYTYSESSPSANVIRFTRQGSPTPTPSPSPTPTPTPSQFTDWIYAFVHQGYSAGCGGGNYCPDRPVTRAEIAVFILKAVHGPGYVPPPCSTPPAFNDVPCP